jgi:hypothetical protein
MCGVEFLGKEAIEMLLLVAKVTATIATVVSVVACLVAWEIERWGVTRKRPWR